MARALRGLRYTLGYGLLRLALASGRLMPLALCRVAGRLLAALAWPFARRDRETARDQLAAAFPDGSAAWIDDTLAALRRHLGSLLGEVFWLWSAPPRAILARTELIGVEHLRSLHAAGHGAILVTAHCGNWEWMNLALGAIGLPMTVATRALDDPRFEEIARRLRGRLGGDAVPRGETAGRRLIAALRRGRVAGLLIDQDIDAPGVFAEFFGRPAWTPSGAAMLATRLGVPIVTGFASRADDGSMRLTFAPPIVPEAAPDDLEAAVGRLTARLNRCIEDAVTACPGQWVWIHRRWQRQPAQGDTVWRWTDADSDATAGAEPRGRTRAGT